MANTGVYVMQVASRLTGMHPQTLRKYERSGLLTPSRSNALRMYSDDDISRLKMIKHLVDGGHNLAGVELALKMRSSVLEIKEQLVSAGISRRLESRLTGLLDRLLETLGTD